MILSTHILPEVELICGRVVMISGGRIVADDSLDGVRRHAGGGVRYRVELKGPDAEAIPARVGALPEVERVTPQGLDQGFAVLDLRAPEDPRTAVARLATDQGWTIRAMERHVPSLEEAFLAIIGSER